MAIEPVGMYLHQSRQSFGLTCCLFIFTVLIGSPLISQISQAQDNQSQINAHLVTVQRGDTLEGIIRGANVQRSTAQEAIRILSKLFDPRKLMPGQEIVLRFTNNSDHNLLSVRVPISSSYGFEAVATADGKFIGKTYNPSLQDKEQISAGPLLWVKENITSKSLRVQKGQTLMNVAISLGTNRTEADSAIKALSRLFNVRRLQINQEVTAHFNESNRLLGFGISINGDLEVAAYLSESGLFQSLRTTLADREKFKAQAEEHRNTTAETITPDIHIQPRIAANDLETVTGVIQKGDTVLEIAMRLGARGGEALAASKALGTEINLRQITIGQKVTAFLGAREGDSRRRLLSLSIAKDKEIEVAAMLNKNNRFDAIKTSSDNIQKLVVRAVQLPAPEQKIPPASENKLVKLDSAPEIQKTELALVGFNHTVATLIINRGDTLMDAAINLGARTKEAHDASKALAEIFNLRRLRVGQVITATFGSLNEGGDSRLLGLSIAVDANLEAAAFLSESGSYRSHRLSKSQSDKLIAALGTPQHEAEDPIIPLPPDPPPKFDWVTTIDHKVIVKPGDTLMEALVAAGATNNDAYEGIKALTKIFDPRKLKAGQSLKITFAKDEESGWDSRLLAISVLMDVDLAFAAVRSQNGSFSTHEIWTPLDIKTTRIAGPIENSLFLAAERGGVPSNTIMELIRIYSWDVDFQRDIQKGDEFEVFFEMLHDETGAAVKEGNILYAALNLSGTNFELYRHETSDGIIDFYNSEGHSVRKALLRTPVNGARLSSNFGMRKHPILGYSKMHKGLDFAAPTGTPIQAAGDGVIEAVGVNGGYGKYIRIRHNSQHKTAYAHLSRYAAGIRVGARVRQGQTIGYIGSTGRSTGPHLHYEIIVNDVQVNPMTLKLPDGKRLQGPELAIFQGAKKIIDENMSITVNDFAVVDNRP